MSILNTNNSGELHVSNPECPAHCSVHYTKTPKHSVSSSLQGGECSDCDDDFPSPSFCDSKGDLTEVEELEDDWNCTFSTTSDSTINLSALSLDRTSSMASIKHSSKGCRCKCHAGRPLKRVRWLPKRPIQKPLNVSISLPVYTNGSYADPRDLPGRPPWFVDLESPRPVSYEPVVGPNANSNNNHTGLTENKSTSSSSNNNDVSVSQSTAKQKTDNPQKTVHVQNNKPSILNRNRGLCILITLLAVVTLVTVGALVYFVISSHHLQSVVVALNPDSPSKQPAPVIPGTNSSRNQTFECGTIPSWYLPDGVQYGTPFVPSVKPGSVGPVNDSRTNISKRIIQGEPANIAQYPWQGALFHETRRFTCGASIILSKWLLTATHCIDLDNDVTKWAAYFGISALTQRHTEGEQRQIVSYISNPNYFTEADFAYDYDITLLELDRDLPFTKFIQPICVPPQSFVFPAGMECYISGWGLDNNEGRLPHPDVIQHAQVDVISNETCNRPDWYGGLVTERMLCAGKIEGGRDACQGDSGGPLSCYIADKGVWMVAGIVSWGVGCGLPKFPGVYTKLSFFTDWIWRKIGQAEGLLPPDPELPEVEEAPTDGMIFSGIDEVSDVDGESLFNLDDATMNPTGF